MEQHAILPAPGRPFSVSRRPGDGLPIVAAWAVAIGGALAAGALTSVGQAVGSIVGSLSNSAGPWCVVAIALVLVVRPRLWLALVLGVVVLELMHVGYWAATVLRGYPDSLSITNFWVLMGIPAGALAGLIATWLRRPGWQRSIAVGLIAAVLAGEGIRALLQVSMTTGHAFWILEIIAAAGIVIAWIATARTGAARVIALATAVVGTAGVFAAYVLLGNGFG